MLDEEGGAHAIGCAFFYEEGFCAEGFELAGLGEVDGCGGGGCRPSGIRYVRVWWVVIVGG